MFKNDTVFLSCIATDKRWNKYIVSLGSLVALVICLPISCIVSMPFSFHDPDVSIAIGAKMCVEVMSVYFVHFRSAARFAAAPAIAELSFRCESANVSEMFTSQASPDVYRLFLINLLVLWRRFTLRRLLIAFVDS